MAGGATDPRIGVFLAGTLLHPKRSPVGFAEWGLDWEQEERAALFTRRTGCQSLRTQSLSPSTTPDFYRDDVADANVSLLH